MELVIIIFLAFFIAYVIESIFGFGGLVISITILSFFMDIKELIYIGMFIGIIASLSVLLTDNKSFSKKVFIYLFPLAFLGTVIGVFLLSSLSNQIVLKVFGVFLFAFAIKSLFFENMNIKDKLFQNMFIFIGEITQGIFGTGGPFTVMGIKDKFKSKSELRTTMAVFFILFNIIRIIQLWIQDSLNYYPILNYWWISIAVILGILIGYIPHLKISEKYFKKGINVLLLFASIIIII